MRLARFLTFLPAALAPLWAVAHESGTQDSILIDGVILDVEAQVRFDSIAADPRNATAEFQAAWTVNGLVGGGESFDRLVVLERTSRCEPSMFSGASAVSSSVGPAKALSRASAFGCRIHDHFVGFH